MILQKIRKTESIFKNKNLQLAHVIYLLKDFHQFSKSFFRNTDQQIIFVNFVIRKLLRIQYLLSLSLSLSTIVLNSRD